MATEQLPTVLLKAGEADRIVAGHPWIYQSAILRMTAQAGDGELAQVKDHRQRFLGMGFFNSKSKIHVSPGIPLRVSQFENWPRGSQVVIASSLTLCGLILAAGKGRCLHPKEYSGHVKKNEY